MINLITNDSCIQCEQTKKHFEKNGVSFNEINIDSNEALKELIRKAGLPSQLPIVLWSGFKIDNIRSVKLT